MKLMTRSNFFAAIAAFALVVTPAFAAHSTTTTRVSAEIPFDFFVGNEKMPAGTYLLEAGGGDALITISNWTVGRRNYLGAAIGNPNSQEAPKLVFQRIGSDYRLMEAHLGDTTVARSLPVPKSWVQLAKQAAPSKVQLALSVR